MKKGSLRIVLYGPPLAGKTTVMRELARVWTSNFEIFLPASNGGALSDRGVRISRRISGCTIEVETLCGAVCNEEGAWGESLGRADGVVLVLDPQETRWKANEVCVRRLNAMKRIEAGCVFVPKYDLLPSADRSIALMPIVGTRLRSWKVFEGHAGSASDRLRPVEWLIEQAIGITPEAFCPRPAKTERI